MGAEAQSDPGVCLEERVFRRLVSGLHASISTHIAATEQIDQTATAAGQLSDRGWATGRNPDLDSWLRRVGRWPDRLHNLYFAFVFALRSVAKAAPLLELAPLRTGNEDEDAAARRLLRQLLRSDAPRGVLFGFDESKMFRVDMPGREDEDRDHDSEARDVDRADGSSRGGASCPSVKHGLGDVHDLERRFHAGQAAGTGNNNNKINNNNNRALQDAREAADAAQRAMQGRKRALREEFRQKFRNISRVMDCVGCEKCRLWGKLQFLGVANALKVLLADDRDSAALEVLGGGSVEVLENPVALAGGREGAADGGSAVSNLVAVGHGFPGESSPARRRFPEGLGVAVESAQDGSLRLLAWRSKSKSKTKK